MSVRSRSPRTRLDRLVERVHVAAAVLGVDGTQLADGLLEGIHDDGRVGDLTPPRPEARLVVTDVVAQALWYGPSAAAERGASVTARVQWTTGSQRTEVPVAMEVGTVLGARVLRCRARVPWWRWRDRAAARGLDGQQLCRAADPSPALARLAHLATVCHWIDLIEDPRERAVTGPGELAAAPRRDVLNLLWRAEAIRDTPTTLGVLASGWGGTLGELLETARAVAREAA